MYHRIARYLTCHFSFFAPGRFRSILSYIILKATFDGICSASTKPLLKYYLFHEKSKYPLKLIIFVLKINATRLKKSGE